MTLKYETGIATLVQFIVLSLLNFADGVNSSVQSCSVGGNDCVSNTIVSLLYFLLIAGWFGFLLVLGFAAQDKRSRSLARVLLVAELPVIAFSLLDLRHQHLSLGFVTSLVDLLIAVWVMIVAFRLVRAKGGRVVRSSASRARARHRPSQSL